VGGNVTGVSQRLLKKKLLFVSHKVCISHLDPKSHFYIDCLLQVLECSWDELLRKVKDAGDLDHIIAAHQEFLDTITTRSLLDSQSHVNTAQ
jgi:Gamma tubulin complex component C-terminal